VLILRADYVAIRCQLQYLYGTSNVDFEKLVLCINSLQWSGSGSKPDPEQNRDYRSAANTISRPWVTLGS